jgi:hypothetical protein
VTGFCSAYLVRLRSSRCAARRAISDLCADVAEQHANTAEFEVEVNAVAHASVRAEELYTAVRPHRGGAFWEIVCVCVCVCVVLCVCVCVCVCACTPGARVCV